ncbi:hypothetical protein CDD80_4825 [Ophiocordyceps camponoti-rufipedis]|uniref:Uncharacterized protein n=1 Tax=Ophiocordyceps camponoti-rufipedis TaxID=2004952 RepID=A0A2C5YW94_9HYPO|nr:hypothetical protein CDD80_4825 [Ophiocordyceps camponoti-rufipedis]
MGAMLMRRELGEGVIAGTVIGIIFFLLALCLYPVIVGLVKRRRRSRPDVETGPQVLGVESGARPSSTDLCKDDVELSRAVKGWGVPCASPALDEGVSLAYLTTPRHGFFPPGLGASADYYYDSGLIPVEAVDISAAPSRDVAQPGDSFGDRVKRLKGQGNGLAESLHGDRQLSSSAAAETCSANDFMKTPPPPQTRTGLQPSPPSCPAPGTVNPMDIMPASTEAEVWHRTEQQLMDYTVGRSPPADIADDGVGCQSAGAGADMEIDGRLEQDNGFDDVQTGVVSPFRPVTAQLPPPAFFDQVEESVPAGYCFDDVQTGVVSPFRPVTPQLPPPAFFDQVEESVPARYYGQNMPQVNAAEAQSRTYLSDQPMTTPEEEPPSVDVSPLATLPPHDTPGELSLSGSDCRSSNSPKSPTRTPSGGHYACDEPGCDQAFDQLHKLK